MSKLSTFMQIKFSKDCTVNELERKEILFQMTRDFPIHRLPTLRKIARCHLNKMKRKNEGKNDFNFILTVYSLCILLCIHYPV